MIANYLQENVAAINRALELAGTGMTVGLVIGSGRWQNIEAANTNVSYGKTLGCFFVNTIEEEYADGIVTASLDIRFSLYAGFGPEEDSGDFDICRDCVYRIYHEGRKYIDDKCRIVVENVRSVPFVNYTGDNLMGVRFRCTVRNIVPDFFECRNERN